MIVLPLGVELPTNLDRPLRDIRLAHPLVQQRWAVLEVKCMEAGFAMFLNEVWRSDTRQQWLWAQGRTSQECMRQGIPSKFARPGDVVTNSTRASNSAHGWMVSGGVGRLIPAACAIDVVPVGRDGKPWTKDDAWNTWYEFISQPEIKALGLVHFSKPGKKPWDMPHLQLREWSDKIKKLVLPS
jgi:hypothetical protein